MTTEIAARGGAVRTLIDVWPCDMISRLLHVGSWEDLDAILSSEYIRGERKEHPYFYRDEMSHGICEWVRGVVILPTYHYPVLRSAGGGGAIHWMYDEAAAAMEAEALRMSLIVDEKRNRGVISYRYPARLVAGCDLGERESTKLRPLWEEGFEPEHVRRLDELTDIVAMIANGVPQRLAVHVLQWINGTEVSKLCDSSPF